MKTWSATNPKRQRGVIALFLIAWSLVLCHTKKRGLLDQNCITEGTKAPGLREDAPDPATHASGCDKARAHEFVGNRNCLVIACFLALIGTATGQDNEPAAPLSPVPQVENAPKEEPKEPAVPIAADKIKRASAGIAAIVGIAILGIGAIAFTMIWARRVRRIARDPGPAQTTLGNDFWFLKPPKQASTVSKIDISRPPTPPETPE